MSDSEVVSDIDIRMLRTDTGDGASTRDPQVGDTVRVGKGKTDWTVTGFWVNGHTRFAELTGVDRAWVRSSATLPRLTVVTRAGA